MLPHKLIRRLRRPHHLDAVHARQPSALRLTLDLARLAEIPLKPRNLQTVQLRTVSSFVPRYLRLATRPLLEQSRPLIRVRPRDRQISLRPLQGAPKPRALLRRLTHRCAFAGGAI